MVESGQFLEGNVLSPKLVGESVGLHPVWLIFALFAFGSLMGFTGMILAVPLAAAMGVLIRFAVKRYKDSALFHRPRPGRRMIGQLPLDLPHRPSFAEEDFLAAPSNEQARALLRLWPDWPHRLLLLTGPQGRRQKPSRRDLGAAGRRARRSRARPLDRARCPIWSAAPALLVEDADEPPLREKELFHLVNLAMERGTFLLVTARKRPDAWGLATKDLLSRLRRAPAVAIEQPDDDFLRAILAKLFHDRQIEVDASLIDFLVLRLERSFEAAQQIVAALDARPGAGAAGHPRAGRRPARRVVEDEYHPDRDNWIE